MVSGYYGNRLVFAPPLVISEAETDTAVAALDKVLGELEKKLEIGEVRS